VNWKDLRPLQLSQMKIQKLKINIKAAKYALCNELHVEYFIYCVLKSFKLSSGKIVIKDCDFSQMNKHTIQRHLKNNIYFQENNGCVYLTNYHKIQPDCENYVVDFDEITKFASRPMLKKKNVIKVWDSTNIKYFLLCVVAAHKGQKCPYALSLIKDDTRQSISTIQRALKIFGVERDHRLWKENSPRSYYFNGNRINLSPNYYKMPVGIMISQL